MAGALLVDMLLRVGDGAVIATISAKRDGKNRATSRRKLASGEHREVECVDELFVLVALVHLGGAPGGVESVLMVDDQGGAGHRLVRA